MPHIHVEARSRQVEDDTTRGRRTEPRHKTVFRPCSVRFANKQNLGVIRNLSEGGASIECSFELGVGDTIEYADGENSPVTGTIIWAKDGRIGVKHHANTVRNGPRLSPRAVRVGCELPCKVWNGDRCFECSASNISQTGALIMGMENAAPGTPLTIELGDQTMYNAQIRWMRDGQAGVQFPEPIAMRSVVSILEAA